MDTIAARQFVRHRGPITCAAGIPYTQKVITSGYDGAVGMFDIETGEVRLLGYHDHLANRVTVNRSGTKAASSSSDYTIYIWDLPALKVERVLRGHSDDVEAFVFISDSLGASVSRDWRVLIWDLDTGSIVRILEGHQKDVLSVDSCEGMLFTSGDDMTLRVWNLETGELLRTWGPFETETDTCAIDRLRKRAVLGCDNGCITVFDIRTGNTVGKIQAHSSGVKQVAISPINGDIISAAYDQRIIIWDGETLRQRVAIETRPALWERSFNWSPDGRNVLAGTFDGTVLVWDATTGLCLTEIGSRKEATGNACLNEVSSDSNSEIVAVSDDGYVRTGRLSSSESRWHSKVEPETGRVLMNAVTISEADNIVVAGAHNQTLHIFDRHEGNLENEIEVLLGEGPINSIRVSHHEGFKATAFVGCYSGAIVRVLRDGTITGKFRPHENAVKALRLHPKDPIGVSCSADGVLASWNLDGRVLNHFVGHLAIIDDVDIDPTGSLIASAGRDFALRVYDIYENRLKHTVSLGRRSPKSLCFWSHDAVVVANYWGELLKVTLPDERVLSRRIADNGISSIVRSGNHLLAVSYDGGAYLINPDDLTVVNVLRAMTQRLDKVAHA